MSGRFWISGVELGMLIAFAQLKNDNELLRLLYQIEDTQYLCTKEEFEKIVEKWKKKK